MEYEFNAGRSNSDGGNEYGYVGGNSAPPHRKPVLRVMIDINGAAAPNVDATDRFYFTLMADGSLIPFGKAGYQGVLEDGTLQPPADTWEPDSTSMNRAETRCKNDSVPSDPTMCAGSIFSNNLKVMYK
jgi:hypothetical protein